MIDKLKVFLKFGGYFIFWVIFWLFFFDIFLSLIIPIFQGRYNTTVVPNLRLKSVDEAKAEAKRVGLNLVVDTIVPSLEHPQGLVIGQEPPPNTKVKRGRKIFVTVSGGKTYRRVPDIVGMSLHMALRSLQDLGFKVKIEPVYTLDEEPGYVTRLEPPPGSDVPLGSTIKVYYTEEPPDNSGLESPR